MNGPDGSRDRVVDYVESPVESVGITGKEFGNFFFYKFFSMSVNRVKIYYVGGQTLGDVILSTPFSVVLYQRDGIVSVLSVFGTIDNP